MKIKNILSILALSFLSFISSAQSTDLGVQFSDAIIHRYQPTIDTMTDKGWDHSNSIILHGIEKIYLNTKKEKYLEYIQKFVDSFIDENGSIKGLVPELDRIHPGITCLFLYEQTGDIKYKKAATSMKNYLLGTSSSPSIFNKTPDGGYWHKNNDHYNNVMTIDGTYMMDPFLVKYGHMFNDQECIDIATFQLLLVASKTFNIDTNLAYHGWAYEKNKSWANPITGTSNESWSRSIGWFSMALVDILEYLPKTHKDYTTIHYLFRQLAIGIKNTQNENDGMWYQMMKHKELAGNYPESSGTGMIVYALKKGVVNGWLDESYATTIEKAWTGLKTFISINNDGLVQINSFNPGMGIKDTAEEYTLVRPVSSPSTDKKQHPHGYCAILMAASLLEQ